MGVILALKKHIFTKNENIHTYILYIYRNKTNVDGFKSKDV